MTKFSNRNILDKLFYSRPDVVGIARDLLGKILVTRVNNKLTSGMIIETEAYAGVNDRASHAFGNRRTKRTEVMYHEGGVAYVYLCYGIHSLFNVVTNKENIPHAVLIRGILPFEGKDIMLERAGKTKTKLLNIIGNGPGKVCKILGINYSHTGIQLTKLNERFDISIWIEDRDYTILDHNILINKRIGIDYAKEDTELPYRFVIKKPTIYKYWGFL